MNIRNALNEKDKRGERFKKVSKGKSNKAKRELELALLKPEKLQRYTGPSPIGNQLDDLSIKLILPDYKSLELFERFFTVSMAGGEKAINATNTAALIKILNLIETNKIDYEKLIPEAKSRGNRRIPKVGERKPRARRRRRVVQ